VEVNICTVSGLAGWFCIMCSRCYTFIWACQKSLITFTVRRGSDVSVPFFVTRRILYSSVDAKSVVLPMLCFNYYDCSWLVHACWRYFLYSWILWRSAAGITIMKILMHLFQCAVCHCSPSLQCNQLLSCNIRFFVVGFFCLVSCICLWWPSLWKPRIYLVRLRKLQVENSRPGISFKKTRVPKS